MATSTSTTSYLDPPQLIGKQNADGTISLTPLELKRLNDYNYYVAKLIQGGLNLANLNKETNDVFTGMVTFTDLSDPTKSTVINGSHITTGTVSADRVSGGTLEGVTIISTGGGSGQLIIIQDGEIVIGDSAYGTNLKFNGTYAILDGVLAPLKISTLSNMSIDSGGTIYIGTSTGYSGNVDIGKTGGTINLVGDVYINGVLQ